MSSRKNQIAPTGHEWARLLREQKARALSENATSTDTLALAQLLEAHRRLSKRQHRTA